jgi:hypothetical protein
MTIKQVHKWIWILVYAGLALLALGLSVRQSDAPLGWTLAAPGIALITGGVVLIWIRSRLKSTKESP